MSVWKRVTDTYLQDQFSPILNYYLSEKLAVTSLASNSTTNNNQVTLTTGHGFTTAGEWIEFWENGKYAQFEITAVAGDLITLSMPMGFPFTTEATVYRINTSLKEDGSVTPRVFTFTPDAGSFDINSFSLNMVHSTEPDDSLFGNLAALTNGIYARRYYGEFGIYGNLLNFKTNHAFKLFSADIVYTDKAGGEAFGTSIKKVFNSQEHNGIVFRINGVKEDRVEVIVRDNLSSLSAMKLLLIGHQTVD